MAAKVTYISLSFGGLRLAEGPPLIASINFRYETFPWCVQVGHFADLIMVEKIKN